MLDRYFFAKHLEKDERIVALVHRHWIVGAVALFWPTIAVASCWAVFTYAPEQMILYIALIGSAFGALWWIRNFFDYYMDVWLVTTSGIIDIDWSGWFRRRVSRILYSDVQGVSYEIEGIAATLFGYGTLSVEKISTGTAISLPQVSRLRHIEAIILHYMEEYVNSKNLKNSKHVQEILANVVAEQMQLKELEEKKPKQKVGFSSRAIRREID